MTSRLKWLALLGVLSVIVWIFDTLLPSHDERVVSRAENYLSRLKKGSSLFSNPSSRIKLLHLMEDMAELGDEKRLARFEPFLQKISFTSTEHSALTSLALSILPKWNGNLPSFQRTILRTAHDQYQAPLAGVPLLHKSKVKLVFRGSVGRYRQLYAAGNWTSDGQLSDLHGWIPEAMNDQGRDGDTQARDGVWTCEVELEKPLAHHFFNVVVRTEPWPQGQAVGWTSFFLGASSPNPVIVQAYKPPAMRRPLKLTRENSPHRVRVALIGMDGASWYVLMPFIQLGHLPHMSEILRNGCAARLTSIGGGTAYGSVPCIHTALTGCLPFRHQTKKDFLGVVLRNRTPRIWKIISEMKMTTAVVGLWGTFPVEKIRGEMVSEAFFFLRCFDIPEVKKIMLHPKVVQFAQSFGVSVADIQKLKSFAERTARYIKVVFPDSLENQLAQAIPLPSIQGGVEFDEQARIIYDRQILEIGRFILNRGPHDLFLSYILGLDSVCHSFWHDFQPEIVNAPRLKPLAPELDRIKIKSKGKFLDALEEVDTYLGELMDASDTVVIFSDHGMAALPPDGMWPILTVNPDKLIELYRLGRGKKDSLVINYMTSEHGIDYDIDNRTMNAQQVESDRNDFKTFLEQQIVEGSNLRLFNVTPQQRAGGRPHLHVTLRDELVQTPLYKQSLLVDGKSVDLFRVFDLSVLEADHAGNGAFMMYGKNIQPGIRTEECYLQDVAPTVLALLGLPADKKMDGEAFTPGFQSARFKEGFPQRVRYKKGEWGVLSLARSIRWRKLTSDFLQNILSSN